jgi:voltage-gated potassium channel Kch
MLATLADGYRRHRFAWLFGSLILTITASPALHAIVPRVNAVELFLAINLVAVVSTVGREHGMGSMLWIGGAFLALRAVQTASGVRAFVPFTEGLWVIGCLLGMLATARRALRGGAVDAERIFAALDAYLLAGLVFGVCYWLLGRLDPLAFNETDLSLARATYFSFVTLATLGYGDVVPRSELVQSLAIVEAVGGQMYLAVLIARLVSLYSRQAEI